MLEKFTSINLDCKSNKELSNYFNTAWKMNEWLFSSLSEDDSYFIAPDQLRHPLIFYYAHTAVFYINKLRKAGLIDEPFNKLFENIFAKGVDPDKEEELSNNHIEWPSLDEVREYRSNVYKFIPRRKTTGLAPWM